MSGPVNINNVKRIWRIPALTVYGLTSTTELEFLAVEEVAGAYEIFYGRTSVGSSVQEVNFSDLIDINGNQLPSQIRNAAVIVQPRGEHGSFVIGNPSNGGFRMARSSSAFGPVEVGLLVIET